MVSTNKPIQFNIGKTIGTNFAAKTDADKVTSSATISKPFQLTTQHSSNTLPTVTTVTNELKLPVKTTSTPFQFNSAGCSSAPMTVADKSKISFETIPPFSSCLSGPQLSTAKAATSDFTSSGNDLTLLYYVLHKY